MTASNADPAMLSILVVSYNTRDLTLACLESIGRGAGETPCQVLVVDNASADGSAAEIAARQPSARLLALDRNLGFAAANNYAARLALGEWILLLNPDTVVGDGAIDRLMAFARQHPHAAIIGGRTLFADGSLNATSCWQRPTPWSVFCMASGLSKLFRQSSWFNPEAMPGWNRDTAREVDIVTGCFLLMRRELWDRLGGFDPAFFMYGEDADLCLRAAKLGHKCLICPDATIIHYGGASEKIRADKMVRLFKAKAQLFRRHWSPAAARFGVAMLDLWALTRVTAFGLASLAKRRHREAFATWLDIWRRRRVWHEMDDVRAPASVCSTETAMETAAASRRSLPS